ncbi:MAG: hypothetical protein IIC83_07725, partial [Chloroflexi bacterium]|nr:hypothetical protein [Chloroflexota bacterium]
MLVKASSSVRVHKSGDVNVGGDESINIHATNVTVSNGLSIRDAKEIAKAVFEENAVKLKDEAADIASDRANEILDSILTRIHDEKPEAIEAFRRPDVQMAIFAAQKEHARRGNKELADLLVDLLVERVSHTDDGLMSIVLDESLGVASKLTPDQLDILSLIFLLRYTVNRS